MSKDSFGLNNFFSTPIFLFRLTAIRLDCNARRFFRLESGKLTMRELIELVMFIAMALFNLPTHMSFLFYGELETTLDQTAFACFTIFIVNSFVKGLTIWFGRRELELLFQKMGNSFPKTTQEHEEYQLTDYYKKIRNHNKSLATFHILVTSSFNVFPLVQAVVELYMEKSETKEFNYRFPFKFYYWFDENQPSTYAFTYIMQCIGSYSLSCWFLGSDLLLITAVHLVNMHLDCLSKRVMNLKPVGTNADIKKLGNLLVYHKEILDCCELIDRAFSKSILANYIASGLTLCLIGFQVVAGSDALDLIKFFLFLISMITHVYFISVYSNTMIDLGAGVSDAFFHHSWYKGNVSYQRMLPLPIAQSQRPAHLTAFKFFTVSMASFKTFMTTTYQVFTLIKTSLDEEK